MQHTGSAKKITDEFFTLWCDATKAE